MNFGVHPLILMAAIGAFLALGAIGVACGAQSRRLRAAMAALALVFLIPAGLLFVGFHPELVDGRYRTYKAFYRDIQIGMTRDQVMAALEHRYPTDGPRQRPKIMDDTGTRLGFFMNPETTREPNCEGIFLTFDEGRVIKAVYSRD